MATPSIPSSRGRLGDPGFHADLLEELTDQVLELERVHLQQVEPAVEFAGGVELVDELELRQIELDDRWYGDQVVGVRGDEGVEVAQAGHRIQVGEFEFVEGFAVRADADQAGVDLLAGGGIAGGDVPVEDDHIDQVAGVTGKAFPQEAQGGLRHDRGVQLFGFAFPPELRVDLLPGPDVLEGTFLGHDGAGREFGFDPQLPWLGTVSDTTLVGEAARPGRLGQ